MERNRVFKPEKTTYYFVCKYCDLKILWNEEACKIFFQGHTKQKQLRIQFNKKSIVFTLNFANNDHFLLDNKTL